MKIIYWETSGYWLLLKRLEKGCFAWPQESDTREMLRLSATELHALLGGLDFTKGRHRAWYRRKVS